MNKLYLNRVYCVLSICVLMIPTTGLAIQAQLAVLDMHMAELAKKVTVAPALTPKEQEAYDQLVKDIAATNKATTLNQPKADTEAAARKIINRIERQLRDIERSKLSTEIKQALNSTVIEFTKP